MRMRLFATLLALALMLVSSGVALAIPTTLIEQGSEWQYQQFSSPDLWLTWNTTAGFSSFDWVNANWSTGNAAFGNSQNYNLLSFNTYWEGNTDLALQKTFTIGNGPLSGTLTLNVAADNGFIIFINGHEIARENAEGFTSYWEYILPISSEYFLAPGENLIQVLAEDHGYKTFFDLKLTGDVPVPEPGTFMLLGAGLVGVAVWQRKRIS